MTPANKDDKADGCSRPWLPFVVIIAASALAHLWCLGSRFYMDDFPQIRDGLPVLRGDIFYPVTNTWTNLWYFILARFFGVSPVAFHAMNWLIHTGVALSLFVLARDLVAGRNSRGVALFAALLFAVHPLASEIPNYARTQDLAWVTLFSLLAGWFLLKAIRGGGWLAILACGSCVLGAGFSKGPGFFHAFMACAAIGLGFMEPATRQFLRKRGAWIAAAFVGVFGILWITGRLDPYIAATRLWSEPRFTGHAYTLSRVFWEFAWRAVLPLKLCSDHLITETLVPRGTGFWTIPDKDAMIAMAGQLAFAAFALALAFRKSTRLIGICLFLFVATMLVRVLYLIPEFMPEYRIYPGLPWFCLAAAIVLSSGWKYLFETLSPVVPAILLLTGFAAMSANRSLVWHGLNRLTTDVLRQYPARARALWEMNDRDLETGNYQAIIDRQGKLWPGIEQRFITENQRLAPAREIPSGDFVLSMVAIFGRYARAVAHQSGNPASGIAVMKRLEAHMTQLGMTPENKALEWGYFYHDMGLLHEMAGNYPAAVEWMRKPMPPFWPQDRARVEKKFAEMPKPGS